MAGAHRRSILRAWRPSTSDRHCQGGSAASPSKALAPGRGSSALIHQLTGPPQLPFHRVGDHAGAAGKGAMQDLPARASNLLIDSRRWQVGFGEQLWRDLDRPLTEREPPLRWPSTDRDNSSIRPMPAANTSAPRAGSCSPVEVTSKSPQAKPPTFVADSATAMARASAIMC